MQLLLLSPLYEKDYILLPSGFLISRLDNFDCVREIRSLPTTTVFTEFSPLS